MAATDPHVVRRPSRWLFAAEVPRGGRAGAVAGGAPALAGAPRETGHTVVVLPGMGADDRSTDLAAPFPEPARLPGPGWGLGTNLPGRTCPAGCASASTTCVPGIPSP